MLQEKERKEKELQEQRLQKEKEKKQDKMNELINSFTSVHENLLTIPLFQ